MTRPAVTIAVRAARAAGRIILRYINRLDVHHVLEKQRMEFAYEIDRLARIEMVKELHRAYPDHTILAEEGSATINKNAHTWVVDPLNGKHNYLRHIPFFSASLALLEKGQPSHSVVFDPLRDELYTASKGDGAYLNDRRIRVGKREDLSGAMIATGFPSQQRGHPSSQLSITNALLGRIEDIRFSGSSALDLAYIAAGRYDAYFGLGLHARDMTAGILLVREAGGYCCDLAGRDAIPGSSSQLMAGNVAMTRGILELVNG